jgi:hypothetical protein
MAAAASEGSARARLAASRPAACMMPPCVAPPAVPRFPRRPRTGPHGGAQPRSSERLHPCCECPSTLVISAAPRPFRPTSPPPPPWRPSTTDEARPRRPPRGHAPLIWAPLLLACLCTICVREGGRTGGRAGAQRRAARPPRAPPAAPTLCAALPPPVCGVAISKAPSPPVSAAVIWMRRCIMYKICTAAAAASGGCAVAVMSVVRRPLPRLAFAAYPRLVTRRAMPLIAAGAVAVGPWHGAPSDCHGAQERCPASPPHASPLPPPGPARRLSRPAPPPPKTEVLFNAAQWGRAPGRPGWALCSHAHTHSWTHERK